MSLATLASRSKPRLQELSSFVSNTADRVALQAWRERALREATTVRRVLRGARAGSGAIVAQGPTLTALDKGSVESLLLTSRFVDMHPDAAATAVRLAHELRASVIRLTGSAALELDLVAGGIGAVLRRSAAPRVRVGV